MIRQANASNGLCPGFSLPECDQYEPVPCAGPIPPAIPAPSKLELVEALRLGESLDFCNSQACFRVLVAQNSVLLRDAIHRHDYPGVVLGSGGSGSLRSSLGSGSPCESGTSGGTPPAVTNRGASLQSCMPTEIGVGVKRSRISGRVSPPKNFQCPFCLKFNNEKDFDRHVSDWLEKSHQSGVVREGCCGGVRDHHHPLLRHFAGSNHADRVAALVNDIRRLIHPGAYDSLGPEGSGRHVDVAQRLQYLSCEPL
jgi:hypothetical protein